MPFNPTEAKNPTRELSNNPGNVYQLQDINHDEIIQQIQTNEQNIKELQKNNPVVELKDTVTENTADNYETHNIKETTSDGTENAVSNFILVQKQITKLETDTTANTLTVSTIDQTGTASSETLALPAGGDTYDDTQVKADITKNAADIDAANSRISALELDNTTNKANIQKNTSDINSLSKLGGISVAYTNATPLTSGSIPIKNLKNNAAVIVSGRSPNGSNFTGVFSEYEGESYGIALNDKNFCRFTFSNDGINITRNGESFGITCVLVIN